MTSQNKTDEIFVGFCLLFKLKQQQQQKVVIMLHKNLNTHHSEEKTKQNKTQY